MSNMINVLTVDAHKAALMMNERSLNKYARGYLVSIDQDGFGYISLEKQGGVFPEVTIGEAVKRLNSLSNSHNKLVEENNRLREALAITESHCRTYLKIHPSKDTIASKALAEAEQTK